MTSVRIVVHDSPDLVREEPRDSGDGRMMGGVCDGDGALSPPQAHLFVVSANVVPGGPQLAAPF